MLVQDISSNRLDSGLLESSRILAPKYLSLLANQRAGFKQKLEPSRNLIEVLGKCFISFLKESLILLFTNRQL